MGFADKLKDLTTKAEDAAATHKAEVHRAVLKAEEAADRQTGGQYHDQIVQAGQKADTFVQNLDEPIAPDPADKESVAPEPADKEFVVPEPADREPGR